MRSSDPSPHCALFINKKSRAFVHRTRAHPREVCELPWCLEQKVCIAVTCRRAEGLLPTWWCWCYSCCWAPSACCGGGCRAGAGGSMACICGVGSDDCSNLLHPRPQPRVVSSAPPEQLPVQTTDHTSAQPQATTLLTCGGRWLGSLTGLTRHLRPGPRAHSTCACRLRHFSSSKRCCRSSGRESGRRSAVPPESTPSIC